MSPDFFNFYGEQILRALEQEKGLRVGGLNVTNISPNVLIAETAADLQRLLDVAVSESDRKSLSINCSKTECMVVTKKDGSRCVLKVKI